MRSLLLQTVLALAACASARSFTLELKDDQVNLQEAELSTDTQHCFWSGTSPFCAGSCDSSAGYSTCKIDGCGDGACCWTGYKHYCCRGSCPNTIPRPESEEIRTTGDDPHDDFCKKGYIIVCPPGAEKNSDCHCIKDPGHGGEAPHRG